MKTISYPLILALWNALRCHLVNYTGRGSKNLAPVEYALLSLCEFHRAGPGGIRSAVSSEFHRAGVLDAKERLKHYRRYVYEAGSLNHPEKGNINVIEDKVIEKERSREFELSKSDRFRYRTRYFTDSGIIGSKQYVSAIYQRFKNLFSSKHEKKPKPIKGLDGMYSLKRLSEAIWKTDRIDLLKISHHNFLGIWKAKGSRLHSWHRKIGVKSWLVIKRCFFKGKLPPQKLGVKSWLVIIKLTFSSILC